MTELPTTQSASLATLTPLTLPQKRMALSRAILAMLQQFEIDNPDLLVADIDIQREDSYVIRNPIVWVDVTVEVK